MHDEQKKKTDEEIHVRTTVEIKNIPEGTVELVGKAGFKIQLEKLRKANVLDQSQDILDMKGQGCISNPGGPGC